MQVTANDIAIEVEDFGNKDDPAILLVMGFAAQLILWPEELVERFVDAGFRVIRFDNRDIGLSQKFDGVKAPHIVWHILNKRLFKRGQMGRYTLEDMAADAVGVMDALEIEKAHVVGASMGGMIAQIIAADYPDRVHSVVPVMTSTNNPKLPSSDKEVGRALFKASRNRPTNPEEAVAASTEMFELMSAPDSGRSREEVEEFVRLAVERSFYPEGPKRQMSAIIDSGDLRHFTRRVTAPALVIHGAQDPLIPQTGGQDVAANIEGARFEAVDGMGHDLPPALLPKIADMVIDHCRASQLQDA